MPSMKAIKRRRLTVKNISQITKAMNLVATSKLQKARAALTAIGEPVQATFDIVYNTVRHPKALEHPLMQQRKDVKKIAYVVMTGNRGMAGGYNANVCKEFIRHAKAHGKDALVIPVGVKGRDYLRRRGYHTMDVNIPAENVSFADAHTLSDLLVSMYTTGQVDEIYVAYTKFVTILNLVPVVRKVLPIDPSYLRLVVADNLSDSPSSEEKWEDLGFFPRPASNRATAAETEFEPNLEVVLASVIPWYLSMFMYAAMASAQLCEQAARMTSMDSATKNAAEIIEKLTLQYNRQRQSSITQEITEIVSGANALQ